MNDDLEPRLRDALRSGSLPPAPASLVDALERVPDAPVRLRRRRGAGPILGLFAAAAILVVASAVALSGGSTPGPAPTAQTPAPSVAAGVPRLHLEYTAQTVDGVAPTPAGHGEGRLGPALPHRGDGRRRPDRHDARPGRGRRATRRHRPGRRRDRRPDARPYRQGRLRPARRDLRHRGRSDRPDEEPAAVRRRPDPRRPPSAPIRTAPRQSTSCSSPTAPVCSPTTPRTTSGPTSPITIDGDVLSAPVIQNAIPNGDIEITGGGVSGLDATHAHGLVALIGSGALPVPVALTSSEVLGLPSADPPRPNDAGRHSSSDSRRAPSSGPPSRHGAGLSAPPRHPSAVATGRSDRPGSRHARRHRPEMAGTGARLPVRGAGWLGSRRRPGAQGSLGRSARPAVPPPLNVRPGRRSSTRLRSGRARSGTAARPDPIDPPPPVASGPRRHPAAAAHLAASRRGSIRLPGDSPTWRRDRRSRSPMWRSRHRLSSVRNAGVPTHDFAARATSNTPMNSTYESPSQTTRLKVPSASWRPPRSVPPTARSNAATASSGSATAMTRWSMPRYMTPA